MIALSVLHTCYVCLYCMPNMTCIEYKHTQYVCQTDNTFMACKKYIHSWHANSTNMTCMQHIHTWHTHIDIQHTQYIKNMQTKHTCVFACMFCIHVCTDMPKKTYVRNILQTNRHLPTPFAFMQDLVRQINTQGSTHTLSHTHTHYHIHTHTCQRHSRLC